MEYITLKDICSKIGSGATPTGGKESYQGGGFKLIRSQNILDLKFSWDGLAEINEDQASKLNNVEVYEGDVLLNITGDSVARSCLAPKDALPARVNQHVAIIRPKLDILNNYYLLCFLQLTKPYLLALASTGGTRNALTKQTIEKLKISLPSLTTQQKIASILSAYDSLIENNTKRIKLLEQMAENLYKEWFVRFRFPGYENVEMENGLPKGWKIERLGNISNISTGKCNREDAEEEGEYPLFDRSQEIKRSSVWIKDCEAIIVPGEGTSFMPRYFKGKFNLHQRCYCVNPNMDNIGFFLFYTLMLNRMYFLSVATGATVPSLRQNNFTKMKFIMPTIELVHKFNSIVQNARNCCDNLYKQNEFLARQRNLLLPRLMSGKLEVKP